MTLNEMGFPAYILKFCEKEQYADDLMKGRLYMKASGYFRKIEDGFQGDIHEGTAYIDPGQELIYLESEAGERICLNGVPWPAIRNFHAGFFGDDRIPMFCASILSDEIVEILNDTSFRLRKEYLEQMCALGGYVVIIPLAELENKLDHYTKKHLHTGFQFGRVSYVDIRTEYPLTYLNEEQRNFWEPFFKKDLRYQIQNEWRILGHFPEPIPADRDYCRIELRSLDGAVKMEAEQLQGVFHIKM